MTAEMEVDEGNKEIAAAAAPTQAAQPVLSGDDSQRIAQIAAALMKRSRSKADGLELLQQLQGGREGSAELARELGLPADCRDSDIQAAYNTCVPIWERNQEKDIEYVVQMIQEKSTSTMEADNRFRHLQHKVGSKLPKGILTQEVLSAAQAKCHEYWSRVTPGNVALIVDKMAGKCPDWESARKKFDWIWGKGDWKAGGRAVHVGGRLYTAEDLEQAERQTRVKFGLPLIGADKRLQSDRGSKAATGKAKPAEEPAKASEAAPAAEAAEGVPVKEAPAVAEEAEAEANKRLATPKPTQSNAEFIAEHMLKKCSSMDTAKKFFDWLRANERQGKAQFKGRVFSASDLDDAEHRCKETWAAQARDAKGDNEKEGGSSSSSSSSSDGESDAKEKEKKKTGGVDELVNHVLQKTTNQNKIEKYFNSLFGKVGKKISVIGRALTQEETTEAWLRCQAAAEESAQPTKKKARQEKVSNADFIVKEVLRKCSDMNKATRYFNLLHKTVGQQNTSGRIFTLDEVTEADLRVREFFEEKEEANESESSESSSSDKPRRPGRQRKSKEELKKGKSKKDLKKKRGAGAEELEGALFGSDSEELSGEESVDAEEEEGFSKALLADLGAVDEEPQALEDGYPVQTWEELTPEVLPGYEGFNQRATAVMCQAQIGQGRLQVTFDKQAACPPLQPHQEAVGFMMHPKSPVSRMLVDHPTGSGKTREMIKVLENYFFDPRPKIPIFPKDPVCRNFYAELLRWPNRYRDYYCCERPADAAIACGKPDWKEYRFFLWDLSGFREEEVRRLCFSIREVLEMKGMFWMGRVRKSLRAAFHRKHPGERMPAAPLRALGYTSAGGSFAAIGLSGKPMSSIMKIGYAPGSLNVYCNKIVLMDEAHNLVRSQTQYAEQLQRLRRLLFEARNLALAGFTGTPILSEPSEGRQLLDIIKGSLAPQGDEGFLSSFPMRPQPLFPVSLPRGLPDGVLTVARRKQLVRKVEIHGEALKVYDLKRRLGLPGRRLRSYCNVCIFHAAFHDGRGGSKGKVLAFPDDCCPKLLAIAEAVIASPEKAVIMIGRTSGYIVMLELMKHLAAKADPPFAVATMNELSEFNHSSNLRGEAYRVLVADSLQCSEGVSFLAVRRTYLTDVPVSPSGFIQQCGRAIRMYGHRGLPEEEQTVTTQMYVTTFPKWMRASSLACWALRAQKKHTSGKEVEKRARVLTARLNRAGISSLEELKARIDAHGEAKQKSLGGVREGKEGLSVEDVLTFLEQNGLWDEAKLLRNADKKDKEKAQAIAAAEEEKKALARSASDAQGFGRLDTLETIASGAPSSDALGRGDSLEGQDDFAAALGSLLEEEMGTAGDLQNGPPQGSEAEKKPESLDTPAVQPSDEAPADMAQDEDAGEDDAMAEVEDRRQELETAMQEEKELAGADELDGEGGAEKRVGMAAKEGSSTMQPRVATPMTTAEVAACLSEALAVLRTACREAEKKPEKASESLGNPATQPSDSAPMETEQASESIGNSATQPSDGAPAETEQASESVGNAATQPADGAPMETEQAAGEGTPGEAGSAPASGDAAAVPAQGGESLPAEGEGGPGATAAEGSEPLPAEGEGGPAAAEGAVDMPAPPASSTSAPVSYEFGEEPWRAGLLAGLEKPRRCEVFCQAMRNALPEGFDPLIGDLKLLSIQQIRSLRDEVTKLEKVETLRLAVGMIKEVKAMISDAQAAASAAKKAEKAAMAAPTGSEALAASSEVPAVPAEEPADPTASAPAEPAEPVMATEPAEPAEPVLATEPAEAAAATEPAELAEPAEPAEPAESAESAEPVLATEPAESAAATEMVEPAEPAELAESAEAAEAAESAEPAEPEEPAEATEATEATEEAEAVSAQPADATAAGSEAVSAGLDAAAAGAEAEAAGEEAVAAGAEAVAAGADAAASTEAAGTSAADPDPPAPEEIPVAVEEVKTPEMIEQEEKLKALELSWRRKLAGSLGALKRSDHVKAALEVAAPGLMEKILAAEAKKKEEEKGDKPEEEEEEPEADLLSLGIGPEHVKRLHDELQRLLEQAEKGAAKPRALVRAMQMLYLAESVTDAIATLKAETADEEALMQLTERSEEFAPALQAMRSLAVDRDVFAHLADDLAEELPEVNESESEASDLEKELGKKEAAPVVLPAGWRLEWVKRKKKEMREFVDPSGNRYRNVREVRAALLEWEAREAALAAAAKAAEQAAAAGKSLKRTRLRSKCSAPAFTPGFMPPPVPVASSTAAPATSVTVSGMDEDAFAEDLLAALGMDDENEEKATPSSAGTAVGQAAAEPTKATANGPTIGAQVQLKGLMAKLGLNGKKGRLGDYSSTTDRWECFLEGGAKVTVKAENFDILSTPSVAKRTIAPDTSRRVKARGRGRGRGAAAKAAAVPDVEEESD